MGSGIDQPFLTSVLDGSGQFHDPAALPPENNPTIHWTGRYDVKSVYRLSYPGSE
jgi:hypothetical protein